jgi:hypothetical protein
MTTEELAAASLPVEPEVQNPETTQLPEGHSSPAASGSRTHGDGEIRSEEEEEVGDVDADVKDLISAKKSGPLFPSFVFRESKVTTNMIREYEATGFFPAGTGRSPQDEQIPTLEDGEVVVFRDFLTCGQRFPCDPILHAILDAFSVKIYQLSPNTFLEVSKFIWIMKTSGCNFGADVFADFLSWLSCQMLSRSTTVSFTRLTTRAALSIPVDRIREKGSREFRSRPAAKQISQNTGVRTGSTSKFTCLGFPATKDQLILSPHLLRR